jgi:hypothetical protein
VNTEMSKCVDGTYRTGFELICQTASLEKQRGIKIDRPHRNLEIT